METVLKRTPLFEEHQRLGAKIVPFAGYEMPVQYPAGITAEHQAVRRSAGLFDVSHMGELEIRGPHALALVQHVTTNDAATLTVGQAQYSAFCRPDGGVIDDCIVYRFNDHYMIVVNASNLDKDRDWVVTHAAEFDAQVTDRSEDTGLIALQGPAAQAILAPLSDANLQDMQYYHFAAGSVAGVPAVISRTGYTGEDGFELYVPAERTAEVWRKLMLAGDDHNLRAAGLGARDSLRLEMGYALYGNDLDERRTPLEAGLGWITKFDKGDFSGRDALQRQQDAGVREKLVGFICQERGFPRHGYTVRVHGEAVGEVTSGIVSPMLQQGIGMAYVPAEYAKAGTRIEIMVRDKPIPAEVTRPPFYREGSVRK
ncbi:MAG TPA: glycine cleavage system aminomethyltransferase GcvT [Longimicrobiales bacterium]|nr:glycine cleavage system aminomethyltransferase GcvT [Longimicrobiales bacterium]